MFCQGLNYNYVRGCRLCRPEAGRAAFAQLPEMTFSLSPGEEEDSRLQVAFWGAVGYSFQRMARGGEACFAVGCLVKGFPKFKRCLPMKILSAIWYVIQLLLVFIRIAAGGLTLWVILLILLIITLREK